ncbi:MAG: 4Fe-4S dicluster domain-containing protein [Elusimicrobiota bacterium]
MYLLIDSDKCTGCRNCELACSFRWDNYFKPSDAAIAVVKYEDKSINLPVVCQHCTKPVCVEVCMTGAIKRDEKTKTVFIDESKCTGCKVCVSTCPFGAMSFITSRGIARKCDLCEPLRKERPDSVPEKNITECIRLCPYNAIELVSEEKLAQKTRQKGVSKWFEFLKARREE